MNNKVRPSSNNVNIILKNMKPEVKRSGLLRYQSFCLYFLLSVVSNSSCGKDLTGPGGANGDKINFDIAINHLVESRTTTSNDFKSVFENGDEIGIFAVRQSGASMNALLSSGNYIHNRRLTYNAATNSWSPDSGENFEYPQNEDLLDFYAYYPYDSMATDPLNIAFDVKTDQSGTSEGRTNYGLSDLLTARAPATDRTAAVRLTFSHHMAIIQNTIILEGGSKPAPEVILRNFETGIILNLANETTASAGKISNIKMYISSGGIEAAENHTYRALVPAQTVSKGNFLFYVVQDDDLFCSEPLSSTLSLSASRAGIFSTVVQTNR